MELNIRCDIITIDGKIMKPNSEQCIKNLAAICFDHGLDECAFLDEGSRNLKNSHRARATLVKAVIGAVAQDTDLDKTDLASSCFGLDSVVMLIRAGARDENGNQTKTSIEIKITPQERQGLLTRW